MNEHLAPTLQITTLDTTPSQNHANSLRVTLSSPPQPCIIEHESSTGIDTLLLSGIILLFLGRELSSEVGISDGAAW